MRYLLIGTVLAYRLIPAPVRSLWSFGGSSNHLALAVLREGGGFKDIRHFMVKGDSWGSSPFPVDI
jgi:hypothetical protein